jgi:hypothetical protein
MPSLSSFEYATVRIVPRVDREEFINAGIVLFCLDQRFLDAAVHLDAARLHALSPLTSPDSVRCHLQSFVGISQGLPDAGPIARLSARERFRWLTAPRSTMLQTSPVHSGLCESPQATLAHLLQSLVASS